MCEIHQDIAGDDSRSQVRAAYRRGSVKHSARVGPGACSASTGQCEAPSTTLHCSMPGPDPFHRGLPSADLCRARREERTPHRMGHFGVSRLLALTERRQLLDPVIIGKLYALAEQAEDLEQSDQLIAIGRCERCAESLPRQVFWPAGGDDRIYQNPCA